MPARSLRIIFSATSAWSTACPASKAASDRPPALPFSLWHVTQYVLTSVFCASIDMPDGAGDLAAVRWTGCDAASAGFFADGVCCAANPSDIVAATAAQTKILI